MLDQVVRRRCRRTVESSRQRAARPAVEGLEGRVLLYAYTGDHFAYGSRITWSIMPDGTNLGATTSNLVATLDARLGAGAWEQAITDAFAQWENSGNVNVAQVPDDGEPFDAGNYQQGSPNFGDIRIGGFAQSSGVLAFTMLPPSANGGSDAGDIFFNTAQLWSINSGLDLETVAVHEIGHAVAGLGESSDPNAAEYEYYNGVKQGLGQDDISGIQAVWGPRQEDFTAKTYANFTPANAANLTGYINPSTEQVVLPFQDVASSSESYWYKVTTPANTTPQLWVEVQSSGLSELSPKVAVFDSGLHALASATAPTTAYGAWIGTSVGAPAGQAGAVTGGQTYYIRVSGSSALANGTGAYALSVDMGPTALGFVQPPSTTVYAQPDQGSGGLFEKTAAAKTSSTSTPSIPLGSALSPGDFLFESTTGKSVTHLKPTHVNLSHPISNHFRKTSILQDDKAKSARN